MRTPLPPGHRDNIQDEAHDVEGSGRYVGTLLEHAQLDAALPAKQYKGGGKRRSGKTGCVSRS